MPLDRAIATLAARQHAVLSLSQLNDLGLTARRVQRRASTGRLHRVHQGVYALVPPNLLTREGLWSAAILACGDGAVLSHRSAAALHGLLPSGSSRIEVTVPRRSSLCRTGLHVHRSRTLIPADTTAVNGIPTTTVARCLLDLGEVTARRRVERACDQAEILELFDLTAVHDQLTRNRRRRGAATLHAILADHAIGSTATWSELEERFLALVREAGLPAPEVNRTIDLHDSEPPMTVDFLWREQRVVVETDGHRTHRTRRAFETDRRRDQRLAAARLVALRFTRRQIIETPATVQATLRALIATTLPEPAASCPRRWPRPLPP